MKTLLMNRIARPLAAAVLLPGALALALMFPGDAAAQALQPVNLLSTADYAVLAGSTITNNPMSTVVGDIGVSPSAGSFIVGFGLTEVTGTIYVVDASYPTAGVAVNDPTRLTAAKGDLTIAYNDAAGRTPIPTGTFLNPGSGNLGGLTLASGLYKFTGAALISGSNLTLTGSPTDVWIFQIASDLTVANNVQVTLAGGAQATNVFWQVGTSATIGVGSVMQGTILADQSINMATGSTLNGRALASIAAVTLDASTVTRPTEAIATAATQITWGQAKGLPLR